MKTHKSRIARSGVQYYLDEELPRLSLGPTPREYRGQRVFAVYRPSFVLERVKDKFANAPVRVGHKWVYDEKDVDIIGRVGTDITISRNRDEVALCASLNVDDSMLPEARELSPGYLSKNRWCSGTAPDGTPYEILCTDISEVNHVAVVDEARGGSDMKMLDGGKRLMVHSGLLHGIKKRLMGVFDGNCEDTFDKCVDKTSELLNNGGDVTEEVLASLTEKCSTLPDSEEKEKLLRYIADIPLLKGEEQGIRDEALNCIKESYKSLDSDAVSDSTEKPMENKEGEKPVEETKVQDRAVANGGDPAPAAPAAPQAPAASADGSIEEQHGAEEHATVVEAINQLSAKMDKLLSALETKVGDQKPGDPKEEKKEPAEQKPAEEKPAEGVGDSLPQYTQSLGAVRNGYSLEDAFAKLKRRK